jgi:hypothetical protein
MCTSDASATGQRRPKTYPEMGLREQSVLSRALRPILQGEDEDVEYFVHEYSALSPQKRVELLTQVLMCLWMLQMSKAAIVPRTRIK